MEATLWEGLAELATAGELAAFCTPPGTDWNGDGANGLTVVAAADDDGTYITTSISLRNTVTELRVEGKRDGDGPT